jgi:hypothetical protein
MPRVFSVESMACEWTNLVVRDREGEREVEGEAEEIGQGQVLEAYELLRQALVTRY